MPVVTVESDASRCWGCGARWGSQWLQWQWPEAAQRWQIAPKELLPILFAGAIWGRHWSGRLVNCRCDNMAVVSVVNSGYYRDTTMMHMLRCLFFMSSHFNVTVQASHIPGVANISQSIFPVLAGGSGCSSASLSHTMKAGGAPGPPSTRLDFATLGPVVQRLLQTGLAPATLKAYLAGKKITILQADWDSTFASDRAGPPAVCGLCS